MHGLNGLKLPSYKAAAKIAFAMFAVFLLSAQIFTVRAASISKIINFQGKITTVSAGTNVSDGTYAMRFKLYDTLGSGSPPTGGTLLWTETYDQPSGVCAKPTLTSGIFNVKLGTCNALTGVDFTTGALYLTVDFAPTGTSYDGEMAPRKQLNAAAFAFSANGVGGDGRIDIAYAPGTTTSAASAIAYNPSVSSSNNALALSANSNVTGAAALITQAGTGVGLQLAGAGAASRTIKSDNAALVLQTTTGGNITLDPQTGIVAGAGALTIRSGGATALTLDAGGSAAVNVGTTNATSVVIGRTSQTLQFKSFSSIAANGVLYLSDTSGTVAETAASTGAQCLISASSGAAPTWGSCGSSSGVSLAPASADSTASANSTINVTATGLTGNTFLNLKHTTSALTGTGIFLDFASGSGTFSSGNFLDFRNNAGAATSSANSVLTVSSAGATTHRTSTNSGTGFQIQNSANAPLFLVDTTSTDAAGTQVNYLTYPGFESGSFSNATIGWIIAGSATLTQNTNKQHTYNGIYSASVVSSSANGGLRTQTFAATPTSGTYIVSFYAKISTGTIASTAFTVQTTDSGAHTCSPGAGITINSSGFQRLYCSLTATGTISELQITQTSGANTIYYDSVQLQKNSYNGSTITTPTVYQIGGIQLRGAITNPLTLINNGDSTTAFQIMNSAGSNTLFTADTLNTNLTITGATTGSTLVNITNNTASNTGNLLVLSATGLTSGNGLTITGGTGTTGNLLGVTSTSTAAPSNGLVRFNFNGIRTAAGVGFQIDDISTTLATAMKLNVNSITTGLGLAIASSSAGITTAGTNVGSLLDITSSGAMTAFTGQLVNINVSSANNVNDTGSALNINIANATQIMHGLSIASATTGNLGTTFGTSGIVAVNMTGAHTGYAMTMKDVTTTGTVLAINDTAAMTAGGGILVNLSGITAAGSTTSAAGVAIQMSPTASQTGLRFIRFLNSSGVEMGSLNNSNSTTMQFTTTSDRRMKGNIIETHYGLTDLMKVGVKDYTWNVDGTPDTGFIAQDLYTVFPKAVLKGDNGTDPYVPGVTNTWGVNYSGIIPLVVKGVQDQQGLIGSFAIEDMPGLDTLAADLEIETPADPAAILADKITKGQPFLTDFFAARVTSVKGSFKQLAGLDILSTNVTAQGLHIDTISAANNLISLMNDAEFFGRPYFNTDTAGFAKIKQGSRKVTILFDNEYLAQPIVNIGIALDAKDEYKNETDPERIKKMQVDQEEAAQQLFDSGIQYVVINKNEKGFTILLNKPASKDIAFSWIALAVKNAKIVISEDGDTGSVAGDSTEPSRQEASAPEENNTSVEIPTSENPEMPSEN